MKSVISLHKLYQEMLQSDVQGELSGVFSYKTKWRVDRSIDTILSIIVRLGSMLFSFCPSCLLIFQQLEKIKLEKEKHQSHNWCPLNAITPFFHISTDPHLDINSYLDVCHALAGWNNCKFSRQLKKGWHWWMPYLSVALFWQDVLPQFATFRQQT